MASLEKGEIPYSKEV